MNVTQLREYLQKLEADGHGELPVCIGIENSDWYMNELDDTPIVQEGQYADSTSNAFRCRVGSFVSIGPC